MTRRTRNVIFSTLFVLFLVIAPLTVFYSLGWRFDWQTKKIYQTGIFYFKIWPKSSDIYINGNFKEKTDFFFGSTLIENLYPERYKIEIKKEGYHDWGKILDIEKRQVTEAKNIVLIPKDIDFDILIKNIGEFFFSPDAKKIILKEESISKDESKIWNLKLFAINKNLKSHLISETDISIKGADILDLEFSPDSKRILLTIGLKEDVQYYILDIDESPATLIHLDFLDVSKNISFHPQDSNKLFVLLSLEETDTLNEVDFVKKEILRPILENVVTYSASHSIYYLNSLGSVFKVDLYSDKKEKLNIKPFDVKEETKYEIIEYNSYIFLKENDDLYILDETKKEFEKFFTSIKNYKISADYKKIVYFNNYEMWVLFLEKQYDQPEKEKGEQLFITRFSEEIDNVFWYTNYYLIFNVGYKIKVAELDDRDKINITDLAEFKDPEIFWANKKLYILSEENLYVSDELTP